MKIYDNKEQQERISITDMTRHLEHLIRTSDSSWESVYESGTNYFFVSNGVQTFIVTVVER